MKSILNCYKSISSSYKNFFHIDHKFLFLLIFLFISNTNAQENYEFTHYTASDGLSINYVTKVFQDSHGFIWIGTTNGLNRFDGYNFKIFEPSRGDTNSISSRLIMDMCEDKDGFLWIATPNGLNKYNISTEKFTRYKHSANKANSLSSNYVISLNIDKEGTLWAGTINGLNRYNRKSDDFYVILKVSDRLNPDSLNSVTDIIEDFKGNLWLGTWNGLTCINKNGTILKQFFNQPATKGKFEFRITSVIFEDKDRNIWIGTNGQGVKKFNPSTGAITVYTTTPNNPNSISNSYISDIFQDKNNNIWIGTNNGLNRYDSHTDSFARTANDPNKSASLISNGVNSLMQDKSGLIWVGTSSGVSCFYLPQSKFVYYTENHDNPARGLKSGSILAAYIDQKNNIWVGSFDGVDEIKKWNTDIVHLEHKDGNSNSISNNFVRSILVDHKGFVWIGTNNDGLNRYNPVTKQFKLYLFDANNTSTISNNGITTLCEDKRGDLWIGTWWGLNHFNRKTEKFTRFLPVQSNPNSLRNDLIWDVMEDSDGMIWIATDRGGASELDPKTNTFNNFYDDPKIKNNISDRKVFTLFQSSDGMIWLGTAHGLNSYNKKTKEIKIYTKAEGLPGNFVTGIQEDNNGFLWIATDKGLSKFDRKNNSFINYNKRNGLHGLEFIQNIALKSKNGNLYFGLSGLMHFNPDSIKDDYLTAPVVFTDLKIYNQSVPISSSGILKKSISTVSQIEIPNNQDVVTIEFALFDYFDVKRNTFSYKLEGFDIGWNNIGSRNTATYTNLPPGEYTFIVRATNNNGVKNLKEASLKIIIVPSFYQTWWFKIIAVIGLILAALLIIHERTRKIKKQNKILESRVAERTKVLDKTILELNQEIFERKKAEEKVQASLKEKEVLLKEIHHRVKNNLQVISSLLYLQSFSIHDEETLNLFEDSQNRIKSMALIHEKLYQSKNLANINFEEYVRSLLDHMSRSLNRTGLPIKTNININNISLSLDNAISCGLIVNELMTNAYKYAFPSHWVNQQPADYEFVIEIQMQYLDKDTVALNLRDNGIGITANIDITNTESLGLKIVNSMIQQLNGSINISNKKGTEFQITFHDFSSINGTK